MPKRWITNLIFEKLPTLQRFYFDTSVFGGVYDIEFDEASVQLFEKVKLGQVVCVYSNFTEGELFDAPERVRNFFRDLSKENLEVVEMTEEAINLAKSLTQSKLSEQ